MARLTIPETCAVILADRTRLTRPQTASSEGVLPMLTAIYPPRLNTSITVFWVLERQRRILTFGMGFSPQSWPQVETVPQIDRHSLPRGCVVHLGLNAFDES